jgi:hypothetical protein
LGSCIALPDVIELREPPRQSFRRAAKSLRLFGRPPQVCETPDGRALGGPAASPSEWLWAVYAGPSTERRRQALGLVDARVLSAWRERAQGTAGGFLGVRTLVVRVQSVALPIPELRVSPVAPRCTLARPGVACHWRWHNVDTCIQRGSDLRRACCGLLCGPKGMSPALASHGSPCTWPVGCHLSIRLSRRCQRHGTKLPLPLDKLTHEHD